MEMNKEKQIEEMAKICSDKCKDCHNSECRESTKSQYCIAETLYNAGYRKQRELTLCDVCKFNPPSSGDGKPCCMCPAQAVIKVGAE